MEDKINYNDPNISDQLKQPQTERAKAQVDKWWSSINTKIDYKELALDIGLPIEGGII